MIKMFRYLKPKQWLYFAISVAFIVVQVYLNLKLPDYMNDITRLINTPGNEMKDIYEAGFKMLVCALLGAACSIIISYFAANIAAGLSRTLREKVYHQVVDFSSEEMHDFSVDSLITRTTNDITQIQMIMAMGLVVMIQAPITAVWAICKIWDKSWQWTTMTAFAVLLLFTTIGILVTFAMPKFRKVQGLVDRLNLVTRENLSGLRVIRAYNAEDYEEAKFQKVNQEIADTNIYVGKFMPLMPATMNLIMNGLSLGIYWIGAYMINNVSMEMTQGTAVLKQHMMERVSLFGDMVVFVSYAIQVVMAFVMLTMIFVNLPRAQVAARRVQAVIDKKKHLKDGKGVHPTQKGTLRFENVSFQYPDASEAVIENVSFEANTGDTVAFIGSTGSGKSTLVNLIPRFYDATKGTVYVDGCDVKDYEMEELRRKVGYIPQKAFLFKGTIDSNMHYGDNQDVSEDVVNDALRIAQATPFIEKMPEGVASPIVQGGTNVSGGQRQRLAIARTLARRPEILIFDDSFSALDYKTDRILRDTLNQELTDTTKVIVAQRIGTIRDANLIIVLDEGKVVGQGTHEELMANCSVYQDIAYSQLSKEELSHESNAR